MTQDQLNEQLFKAVRDNDIEDVKQAIEDGANVNAPNKYGHTPLHWAAWNGYTEIAKMLLEKGANVNAPNKYGATPLHDAAWNEHTETVKLLKQHGGV